MTTIIIKNSSTASAVPLASDLVQGELAVNVTDKKIYTKDSSNAVVEVSPAVTYTVGDGGLTEKNFTTALKTKLDGVETGATADQTAAEILAALLTVDGSGSGLDADKVDGYNISTASTGTDSNTIYFRTQP